VGRLIVDCPSEDLLITHLQHKSAVCKRKIVKDVIESLIELLYELKEDFNNFWKSVESTLELESERIKSLTDWDTLFTFLESETGRKVPRDFVLVHPSLTIGSDDYSFTLNDKVIITIHLRREKWDYILTIMHELLHSMLQSPDWYYSNKNLAQLVEKVIKEFNVTYPPGYPNAKLYFEENFIEALVLHLALKWKSLIELPEDINNICFKYWERRGLKLAKWLFFKLKDYNYSEFNTIDEYLMRILKAYSIHYNFNDSSLVTKVN